VKRQLDFSRNLQNPLSIPSTKGSHSRTHRWLPRLFTVLLALLMVSSAQAQTNEILFTVADWFSSEADNTSSLAWGDVDGDGDLDLAVGNIGEANRLYRNESGLLTVGAVWSAEEKDSTTSVAWGDVDGDGDLDLAVGNDGEPNRLYRNENGVLTVRAHWSSVEVNNTKSIAWGDVDGDGDLDLAVGNAGEPNHLYRNDNGILTMSAVWSSDETDHTESIAWGDVDGDGDLDLAVGNSGFNSGFNRLYRNENGMLISSAVWSSDEADDTMSVAWGDVDGDGDLDLAVGNHSIGLVSTGQYNQLYRNDGGVLTTGAIWSSDESDGTENVAWGDVDGDGDLDLAVGNIRPNPNRIYRNDDGVLTTAAAWSSVERDPTSSIAWGDVDGDGDLDLVVGNADEPNRLYRNGSSVLTVNSVWSSDEADSTWSVAWGDVDGDSDLDFAVGNVGESNRLYRNDGGVLTSVAVWSSAEIDHTRSVAWGDVDSDGDLDLAVGNDGGPNRLYRNDGGALTSAAVWSSSETDHTESIAWGDVDGDGDLDLAVGNSGEPNRFYRNSSSMLTPEAVWSSNNTDSTWSVAWGDVDGDGDLDLAVGNYGQPNRLYRNDAGMLTVAALWSSGEADATTSVAWGDIDGDGDLDLAAGNSSPLSGQPSRLYRNDGGVLTSVAVWSSVDWGPMTSVAWGDVDSDSDLDLVASNRLYRNDGGVLTSAMVWWFSVGTEITISAAWGDVDGDGDLDLGVGNLGQPNRLYRNSRSSLAALSVVPTVNVSLPIPHGQADRYSGGSVWSAPTLPITYHLFHPQFIPAGRVYGYYSLDGGGRWLPALPTSDTNITGRASAPYPITNRSNTHVYNWDVAASGVMGQSDNVVFRLVVFPDLGPRPNRVPGPFLHGSYAATTFPFRLRGTQVKVEDSASSGLSQALIYRLPEGQSSDAQLYTDRTGLPYHTDLQGYLQGRGELRKGDYLSALWPVSTADIITFTRNSNLYYTSAKPTAQSLELKLVENPGVQILTVSEDNKLLLFDLDVALEWDARKDAQFLSQLAFNLQRTSQLLFDWTNGQAALGQVRIFHDAKRNTAVTGLHPWGDSHIRIYATNRMRPSATVGGIISPTLLVSETVILDGQPKTITYGAGQVRMGAIWNRYGEATGTLGEDWPRALAHELGHYLFFLEDDYLGLNEQGLLVTIPAEGDPAKSCPGAMNDPYRDSQSEFHPAADWLTSGCVKTLAHQSTGRPDWKTIYDFYGLTQPTESFSGQNLGPNTLPLAVTQLDVISPDTDEQTVVVPIFYLTSAEGSTYLPSSNAQAYLFQDEWLTDLGQPTLDQVQAWGARPGDRLCIFEAATGHRGCEQITDLDDQVAMNKADLWQPEITVSPVTSRTIAVSMTVAADGARLAARLYPTDQPASPCIFVNPVGIGHYAGLFSTLNEPALDGYIHVWVQSNVSLVCSEPQGTAVKEVMTAYAIGGNPVHVRSRRTLTRGGGVHVRSRRAPAISADGQVMVFGAALETMEEEEWFFTLQASSILPHIPPGRTLVGQAYRLTASANAPDLSNTSISFGYLGEQVPPSEEGFLRLYFWDTNADACQPNSHPCWRPLTTFTDAAYNVASAKTQGTGLYALMSSLEIPLPNAGWNSFAYPVPGTRPVEEALAAIKGAYTIVYGYQQTNVPGFWSAYSPAAPDWVNDLSALTFGQGYWIYTTKASTLYFGSQEVIQSASVESLTPPAIYYGTVTATPSFTPLAGMAVSAWIDGYQCGSGQIQEQGGEFVYVIKVEADDAGIFAGCGGTGRTVTFQINHMSTDAHADWDNTRVQNVQLSAQPERHVFLPLIQR